MVHGGHGVATRVPTVAELVAAGQVEIDRMVMALVPSLLASRLKWTLGTSLDGLRQLRLIGDEPVDQADLAMALGNLDPLMRPASRQELAAELTRLRGLTAQKDRIEPELSIAAWVDELGRWPADVSIRALREWKSLSKWWPTWNEIEGLMARRTGERLELYARLRARLGRS